MKSPADMKIIQIELTNNCIHRCSNCTRFCGHHKKPFFMDFDTFKKAVDSLKDFPHMVGIMGGEPTIHPEFEKFVAYYTSVFKPSTDVKRFRQPIRKFIDYYGNTLRNSDENKRGLWTSLGNKYYQHFELIMDSFEYQCINDHVNPGLHQALLITRKELGIPDKEWIKLRDKCWIQNLWSASITPKGAFFCEVAAALDMLFDGPGGWPIEPGWWKRKPEDFGEQLNWCEMCSAALRVPRNRGNEEIDIISPVLYEKLKSIGSPKIENNKYKLLDPGKYRREDYVGNTNESSWYLSQGGEKDRIIDTNNSLYPRSFSIYINNLECCRKAQDEFSHSSKYKLISLDDLRCKKFQEWCIIINKDGILNTPMIAEWEHVVFNPGCLYYYAGKKFCRKSMAWEDVLKNSKFIMFNLNSSAVKETKEIVIDNEFIKLWDFDKIIHLDDFPNFTGNSYITKKNIINRVFSKIKREIKKL